MLTISNVQSLLQVNMLRHSYPVTCPVKIFLTWPCPVRQVTRPCRALLSFSCRLIFVLPNYHTFLVNSFSPRCSHIFSFELMSTFLHVLFAFNKLVEFHAPLYFTLSNCHWPTQNDSQNHS